MGKYSFVIDFKFDGENIYFLEAGSAMFSSLPPVINDRLWYEMEQMFPGKRLVYDCYSPEEEYSDPQYTRHDVYNLYQKFAAGLIQEPSLLLFENKAEGCLADAHIKLHKLSNLEVYHGKAALLANDKMLFSSYCKKSGIPTPKTWVFSPESFQEHALEEIKQSCKNGVVIKPSFASNGLGVAYVPLTKLKPVLDWLNGRSSMNPLASDKRFNIIWDRFRKEGKPYLIQEAILTASNNDEHEKTYRAVFTSVQNETNISLTLIGITEYYSCPIAPKEERDSSTVISTSKVMHEQLGLAYKEPVVLNQGSGLYHRIATKLYPLLGEFASDLDEFNPVEICLDECLDAGDIMSPYITDTLTIALPAHMQVYTETELQKLAAILRNAFSSPSPKIKYIDAVLDIIEAGYFHREGKPIHKNERTDAFYQFILYILNNTQDKKLINQIKLNLAICKILDLKEKNTGYKISSNVVQDLIRLEQNLKTCKDGLMPKLFGPYKYMYILPKDVKVSIAIPNASGPSVRPR